MARTRPRPARYVRKLERNKPCIHGEAGLELRPHQIILRPLVTEKGTHQSTRYNSYAFMVHPLATKIQIAKAVEELFPDVKVERVRTMTRKGKKSRFRFKVGQQPNWKKALVTLGEDSKIDFI